MVITPYILRTLWSSFSYYFGFCLFEILIHFKIRRVFLASLCEHVTHIMNEIFQKKKKKGMGEIVTEFFLKKKKKKKSVKAKSL